MVDDISLANDISSTKIRYALSFLLLTLVISHIGLDTWEDCSWIGYSDQG